MSVAVAESGQIVVVVVWGIFVYLFSPKFLAIFLR
jgi:hypothetical protein